MSEYAPDAPEWMLALWRLHEAADDMHADAREDVNAVLSHVDEQDAALTAARERIAEVEADRDSEQRWAAQYHREADAARAENARLREVLREVEWMGTEYMTDGEVREWDICPLCRCEAPSHAPDCRLAAALSSAATGEGEEG
jgi:DNA repair exonuclease SbcCD ATPase subunit